MNFNHRLNSGPIRFGRRWSVYRRALWWGCFGAGILALVNFGAVFGQAQGPPAAPAPASGAEPRLSLTQAVTRVIKGGQTHSYPFELKADECLHVKVEQKGISLALAVRGPANQEVAESNFSDEIMGPDFLTLVASDAGSYRLDLTPDEANAPEGSYTAKILELRPATAADRDRQLAQQKYMEGRRLHSKHTKETAVAGMEALKMARDIFHRLGDAYGESYALLWLAEITAGQGQKKQAREIDLQALALRKNAQDPLGDSTILNNLGVFSNQLGEPQQALDYYEQARKIRLEFGDTKGLADILSNIGSAYDDMGQKQKALEYYAEALPIKKSFGNSATLAETLNNIGTIHNDLSENQRAIDHYTQALAICDQVGDRKSRPWLLNNIALSTNRLGEPYKAIDSYTAALEGFRLNGNKAGEALVLNNLGFLQASLGRLAKAETYLLQALPLFQVVGNKRGEAGALNNLGYVARLTGSPEQALDYYNRALALRKSTGTTFEIPSTLNNIATVWINLGETQKAREILEPCLEQSRQNGDRELEHQVLGSLGQLAWGANQKSAALAFYRQAVAVSQATGARKNMARTLFDLAQTEYRMGLLTEAKGHVEAALSLVEFIRANAGLPDLRTSFFATVQTYYRLYIDVLLELHQAQPQGGFDRLAFRVAEQARARSLLDLLGEARVSFRQGVDPQLLQREQDLKRLVTGKFEGLSRLLAKTHTDEQKARAEKEIEELTDQYHQVQAEIRLKSPRYAGLTQTKTVSVEEVQKDLLDPDTVLLEFVLGENGSHLFAVSQKEFAVFPLPPEKEINQAARRVYDLATRRATPLKETTKAGKPRAGETAEARVSPVVAADREFPAAAAELSRLLLAPALKAMPARRLVMVADGALQTIPFGALPAPAGRGLGAGGWGLTPPAPAGPGNEKENPKPQVPNPKFLIEEYEIVVLPSASTLAALRREAAARPAATKGIAILADPVFSDHDDRLHPADPPAPKPADPEALSRWLEQVDQEAQNPEAKVRAIQGWIPRLPGTRQEAEAIRAVMPAPALVRLDFQASRANVLNPELGGYRYIHLATHGSLNAKQPELSAVLLSLVDEKGAPVDGFLRLEDLYNLNWPAEVVTLSACQTGLGTEVKGEGIVGLTRGLMYAGARRVVVSSWNVNDRATAQLMARFYRLMVTENMRPAAALQQAQIQMLADRRWRQPFYWAAFQLQGEWR